MMVVLTPAEIFSAALVGVHRNLAAVKRGLPDRHGHSGAGWSLHIEGACGEMAVAKALGRYWGAPINTFGNGGDVGQLQVRTRSRADYDLIVRPSDKPNDVFVLVRGQCPQFEIVGCIKAVDAQRPEWWAAHGGRPAAWFVPEAGLSPIEAILEMFHAQH